MGAAESAQRDGITEDDAKVQDSVEVDAEQAEQNLEVKLLQKNGQISRMNGAPEDQTEALNGLCEEKDLAEVAADGPSVIEEAVEPAVINVNEEQECMISEDSPKDENKEEKTAVTEDEIGFKKIVKFFELKFTVTKDKADKADQSKDESQEGLKSDASKETSSITTDQDAEGKSEEEPVCVDLTADSAAVEPLSKPTDEATVQQTSDTSSPNEEVTSTEGDLQEQTSPGEGEEDLSPIKKFFTTGIFSGLKKKKKEETIKEEAAGEELQTIEKEETEKAVEEEAVEPAAQESKVEDAPAGTNESELLGSQEKPKVEGSPLKRLFSRLSTRKLKVPEPSETTDEEQAKSDASKKEETPLSSPDDKSKDESKHESDGEGASDGERKRPWSSFRKLVTPKRQRPKAESEEEVTEKTSSDIPSPETQEDVKPSEEPEQTEPSLEEPKKKSDLSVSWEALICGGSTKKRSRKGSNSEDDVAVEKDSRPEDDQGKTAESPLGSSLEGDDEHVSSSLEQSGSPAEGDGGSTWKSLKKLVTPKRKLRVGDLGEQIPSDGETTKEETSFSVKKLIPGRKKRRSDGRQEQTSSDEASKDVGSEDEDDETPSVVPLSEFDVIEPSMVHTIPKGEEPTESTTGTEEMPPPDDELGRPIVATVPKDFEDLTDYITKHQPLSDIPEESIVSPAGEEACQDDTIAEDIAEWTSEAFTAAEPPTEVSFVTAVSHLSESPKSSGASTPVASEGDIKDTDVVLQEAVETVSIIPSNLSVTENEKIMEVAAVSLTPQLLGTSITEETKILTAHEKFEATNICIGLSTEDIGVSEEMPPMTTIEAPPEVSEALPTECAPGEDLAMEPEVAGITEEELHQAGVKEVITEFCEEDYREEKVEEAEADQSQEMPCVLENQQETELVNGIEEIVPIHIAITIAVQGQAQYLEGQVIAEDTPRPALEGPMDSAIEEAVCVEPTILAEVTVAGEKEQEIPAIETTDADILHGTLAELAKSETREVASSLEIPTDVSAEMSEAPIPVVAPTVQSTELQEAADIVEPGLDSITSVALESMTEEVAMENVHAVCSDDHEIQVQVQDVDLQSVEPVEESTLEVASADEVIVQEMAEKEETESAEEVAPSTAPEIIQQVEVEDLSAIGDESVPLEDNQAATQGESTTPQAIVEEKSTSELGLGLTEVEAQAEATEKTVEVVMETHEPAPSLPAEATVSESTAEAALLSAVEVQTSSLIEPELDTPVAALQTETPEVTALEVEAPIITEPEVEIASVTSPEEAVTETAQEGQAPTLAAELVIGTAALTELEAETPVAPTPEVETPVVTALEVETSVASEPELQITEVQEMEKETPVVSAVEVDAPVQSALEMETTVNTKMEEEIATVATVEVEKSIESELAVETVQQAALEKETAVTIAPEEEIAVAAIPKVETAIVETSVAPQLEATAEVVSTPEELAVVAITPEVITEVGVTPEVVAMLNASPEVSAEVTVTPEVVAMPNASPEVSAEVANAPEVAAPPVVITEVTPAQAVIAEVTPAPVVMKDITPSAVPSTGVSSAPVLSPDVAAAPAVIPEVAPAVQAVVIALPELQGETTVVDAPELKAMIANALVVETPSVVVPEVQVDPAVIVSSVPEVVPPPKVETAVATTPEVRAMAAVQTEKAIVEAAPPAPIAPVPPVSPVNVTVTIHVTSTIAKSDSEPKVDAVVSTAPVTPTPVVAAPVTPTPVVAAPVTPTPVVAASVAPAPVVATPVAAASAGPALIVPAPVVVSPVAQAPVVVASVAPAPVMAASVAPAPVMAASLAPAPVMAAPVPVVAAPVVDIPSPIVPDTASIAAPVLTAPVITAPAPTESALFAPVPIMATPDAPVPVEATTVVAAPIAPVVAAPAVMATSAPAPIVAPPVMATSTLVEAASFAPVIAAPTPVAAAPIAPTPVTVGLTINAPLGATAQKPAAVIHIPLQVTIPKTKADTPEAEDDVWEDAVDDMAPKVEVVQPIVSPPIVTVAYVYPQAEHTSDPIQSMAEGSVTQEASLKPEEGPASELQASSEFEFQDAAENSDSTLNGT